MTQFKKHHASHISNNFPCHHHVEAKLGPIRSALLEQDVTRYFAAAKAANLGTCKLCAKLLSGTGGTQLCDECWEASNRQDASLFSRWAQLKEGRAKLQELLQTVQQVLFENDQPPIDE